MGFTDFLQKNRNTIIIIVIILVIHYFLILRNNTQIYNFAITGFWKADSEFLQDAGLTSFLLYFAPTDWKGSRACYLLAEKGDELVVNEPCSVVISQTWKLGNWSTEFCVKTYDILFKDLESGDMPSRQTVNFYPKTGKLIMSKGDVIYGIFYKDAFLTDTMYQANKIKPEEEVEEEDE